MKTAAKVLGWALLLGILVWVGSYLYWHVRILGIIRALETHAPVGISYVPPEYIENVDLLTDTGCRSLSYLVASLGSSKAPSEMSKYFFRICCNSQESGSRKHDEPSYIPAARLQGECLIDPADPPPVRQHKIERIRAWWAEAGPDYHQWWRVWSSNCRGAR